MVRVRFAPSPTGFLHIGSARTALFNYLFAKRHQGTFILRIEDTDVERSKTEYLEEILEDLHWLGLEWDEGPGKNGPYGPYSQLERLHWYEQYARQLMDSGQAYPCYCSAEELAREREAQNIANQPTGYSGRCRKLDAREKAALEAAGTPKTLRFKVPPGITSVPDLIRGEVNFDNALIEDFIILKADGVPVYNFAVVVDDALMDITHIIRGEEHLSNTPRQVMLYNALHFTLPRFAHIPIILDEDRTKLSKRKGATNLREFKQRGYLPQALFNFLALLGWSPGNNRELLTREELESGFDLAAVSNHPAVFDIKKLEWLNSQYLKNLNPVDLARLAEPFFAASGFPATPENLQLLAGLFKTRLRTLEDFPSQAAFFYQTPEYQPEAVQKYWSAPYVPEALQALASALQPLENFSASGLETVIRPLAQNLGLSAAQLIHPTRVALTGKTESPGLFEIMEILGRAVVLERLQQAQAYLKAHSGKGTALTP